MEGRICLLVFLPNRFFFLRRTRPDNSAARPLASTMEVSLADLEPLFNSVGLDSIINGSSAAGSAVWIKFESEVRAAHAAGCTIIVLGAWGCGVFGNQPPVVAELWSEVLDSLEWRGRFTHVVFAVPQGVHGRSIAAFRRALRPLAP